MNPLQNLRRFGPALLYGIVAFLLTGEVWVSDGTLIGVIDPLDRAGTIWAAWWTGHAVLNGLNPFQGTWNFVPFGQSPVAQYNLLDAFLFAPLIHGAGPRVGFNLATVLTLSTTALGTHHLARVVGTTTRGAILAGLCAQSSSFVLLEISCGRLSQALLIFWLLALAGVVRIRRAEGSRSLSVVTGVCTAASALVYWYYGLFLAIAAACVWFLTTGPVSRKAWKDISTAAAVGLLICLPFVLKLAKMFETLPGVEREVESWISTPGLDQGSFGLANAIQESHWAFWPIWSGNNPAEHKMLPIVVLCLAAWSVGRRLRGWAPWMGISITGWVLAMGPYLQDFEQNTTSIPLPFLALYNTVPFFSRFWWPMRFELLAVTGLAILAGLAMDDLLERWPRYATLITIAALMAIFAEAPWRNSHLPLQTTPAEPYSEALYAGLEGPLLTTPVLWKNDRSRIHLWLQAHHEQPIFAGLGDHIPNHRPPGWEEWAQENTLLNSLHELVTSRFQGATIEPEDVQDLVDSGFRYVVVDPATQPLALTQQWAQTHIHFFKALWGKPMREVDGGAVWEIQPIDEPSWVYTSFQARARKTRRPSTRGHTPEKESPPQTED